MSELEIAYKRAIVKFVQVECPRLIEAMQRLERAVNNMPRSLRMHP